MIRNCIYPSFKKNNIPIVFSSDNNYCPYLGVAIKSIIDNSSIKNNHDVIILNEDISRENKEKIFHLIKNIKNFSIRFINVKNFIKKPDIFYVSGYFSIASYYRLFLEKICKNYKKIIYLDCDVVVVGDISKLFKIKLGNKLLGAVITHGISKDQNFKEYINKTLKISDQSKYFNSGVLLIDIKNITKFKLLEKSIKALKKIKTPIFVDQCILNSVCFKKVKFIKNKFNHYAGFIKDSKQKLIVHYNGDKPWEKLDKPLGYLFWKYAKLTDFYQTINYIHLSKKIKKDLYLKYKKTRKAKTVIYTSFTGNYDSLINHKYISKDFDYICFTDKKIKNPGIWEIKKIINSNLDLNRKSKQYKIFSNKFLNKYKYSIWVDSNIDIVSNTLEKRVDELIKQNKKISIGIHFERNCIYQEARACINQQRDEPEIILKEIKFLKKERYPKNNGLFENNIIFREHNNHKIIKLMENWWWMIENFSRRDQLSFNYVLWKNKIECIPLFSQNPRLMTDDFIFKNHNTKIVSTLFIGNQNGFNENDFIQKIIILPSNKYKAIFNLEEFKNVNQLHLNILKNKFCQFKIEKIIVLNNKDKKEKLDISKINFETNGEFLEYNLINFKKISDPQIIFKIPKNTKKITVYGKIEIYNLENLYISLTNEKNNLLLNLNNIKDENNRLQSDLTRINQDNNTLQSDLSKIKSSKTYKLWQKFNKLKKILKIK